MMHREKNRYENDVLVGEYSKSSTFTGYYIFAPVDVIERYAEDAIFRFYKTKGDNPIMAGNIINIYPFEDDNRRIYTLILDHVLMQMKCCLFPVVLSPFHRHARKLYIRAVKKFERKPSILYTMIVKYLKYC